MPRAGQLTKEETLTDRVKIPGLVGELAAEFAGTMILILFGLKARSETVDPKAQKIPKRADGAAV